MSEEETKCQCLGKFQDQMLCSTEQSEWMSWIIKYGSKKCFKTIANNANCQIV